MVATSLQNTYTHIERDFNLLGERCLFEGGGRTVGFK